MKSVKCGNQQKCLHNLVNAVHLLRELLLMLWQITFGRDWVSATNSFFFLESLFTNGSHQSACPVTPNTALSLKSPYITSYKVSILCLNGGSGARFHRRGWDIVSIRQLLPLAKVDLDLPGFRWPCSAPERKVMKQYYYSKRNTACFYTFFIS